MASDAAMHVRDPKARDDVRVQTYLLDDNRVRVTLTGMWTNTRVEEECTATAFMMFITIIRLWLRACGSPDPWIEHWLRFSVLLGTRTPETSPAKAIEVSS